MNEPIPVEFVKNKGRKKCKIRHEI